MLDRPTASRKGRTARALKRLAAAACLLLPAPTSRAADPPAASPVGVAGSFGSFTVTPSRVVLEGALRSAEITLINSGPASATYRLSLIHLRMAESGALSEIDSAGPGETFADALIRYSPQQVELEPGVPQTVRLLLRGSEGFTGEARSHLVVRAIPAVASADSGTESGRQVAVGLTPVYGVAIPVIVRRGAPEVSVHIDRLLLTAGADGGARLEFALLRSGGRSVYGHVEVTLTARGERPRMVGALRGVAIYVPNDHRLVEIPLSLSLAALPRDGRLSVRYEDAEGSRGTIAEAEFALP